MPKYSQEDVSRAREWLQDLRPGDSVSTVLRHVSSSGMARWISPMIVRNGAISDISWPVSRLIGMPLNSRNHEGIFMGGCGMDMGFSLVYSLSSALYPNGFNCVQYFPGPILVPEYCTQEGCGQRLPSSSVCHWSADGMTPIREHSTTTRKGESYRAIGGERKRKPKHCPANDHVNYFPRDTAPYRHSDGGYALTHRWI